MPGTRSHSGGRGGLEDPRRARRTQAARSAETRAKLMAAAIECLCERGYAGTTTIEVALKAGVSRGAQLHHFPTKAELVTSAVRHLAEEVVTELRRVKASIPRGGNRLSGIIDELWTSVFSGPLFVAAVELWVASRTDPELHAMLVPTERETGRIIARFFQEELGGAASIPRFWAVVRLTINIMRGMALEAYLEPDDTRRLEALTLWKQLARSALDPGTDMPGPRRSAARLAARR